MKTWRGVVSGIALLTFVSSAMAQSETAQNETPSGALSKMPVREVTIFKDGHAFVLHEGNLPTDGQGNIVMDYLPNPVIGTFWPYVSGNAKLQSVVAARRMVSTQNTALSVRELIEANIGADVVIREDKDTTYTAKILAVPEQPARDALTLLTIGERSVIAPPEKKGSIVMLQNASGVRVLPIERIQDITFKTAPKTQLPGTEWRNLLTLNLGWNGQRATTAPVGMMYLQKGMRWIPGYRVELDGNGKAQVKLQATLLNELTDLNNVTANLVIGVPSFAFKETPDPISLQDTLAQLSRYFQENGARGGFAFSNAIATQTARMGEYRFNDVNEASAPNLGPEIGTGGKNEDLFLFPVRNVSLKKGERMNLPVAEYSLAYKDIYTLDLPFSPPTELSSYYSTEQQREIARLFAAPKVEHKLRLTNSSTQPLSTAPALILKNGTVLAQSMMTYASPGGDVDLDLTTAVDVRVSKEDQEIKRTANAMKLDGYDYSRVDMAGKITLCNYGSKPIELDVTRHVLGNSDGIEQGGIITRLNVFEDDSASPSRSFPDWWTRFNGRARLKWKVKLEPRKEVDLNYRWHYFWR